MSALIPFSDFAERLPGISLRTIQRLAKQGRFPTFLRLAPHGPPLWARDAVDAWFVARFTPLYADLPPQGIEQ